MAKKKLNIAIIGGGFMGRTHSNAFRQAPEFFTLDHEPVLKAVCTRNAKGAADFAANWGFEILGERLAQADRPQGHRPDRHRQPQRHPCRDRRRGGRSRQDRDVREAARPHRRRGGEDGRRGRKGQGPEHGLVQLPARAGGDHGQEADRRGPAGEDLPLPRQVPAGLDHLGRRAAGRPRHLAPGRERGGQRRHRRSPGPLHRHRDVAQRRHRQRHRRDRDLRQAAQARGHRRRPPR